MSVKLSDFVQLGQIIQVVYSKFQEDLWHFRGELVEFVPANCEVSIEKVEEFYGSPKLSLLDEKRLTRLIGKGVPKQTATLQVEKQIFHRYEKWKKTPKARWFCNRLESFDQAKGLWMPHQSKTVLPDQVLCFLQTKLAIWNGEKFEEI